MLEALNESLNLIILQTQRNHTLLLSIAGIEFGVYLLSFFFPIILYLGIRPRHLTGLTGIFFAPFLHANFNHLFFNTLPLVVLSDFILINGITYYLYVTITIAFIAGLLTWCFAKPGIHVGASSIITGYWGLLVLNIYEQASLNAIILGGISVYYFIGIFLGIFPSKKGISWEGHLFGLTAGLITGCYVMPWINV